MATVINANTSITGVSGANALTVSAGTGLTATSGGMGLKVETGKSVLQDVRATNLTYTSLSVSSLKANEGMTVSLATRITNTLTIYDGMKTSSTAYGFKLTSYLNVNSTGTNPIKGPYSHIGLKVDSSIGYVMADGASSNMDLMIAESVYVGLPNGYVYATAVPSPTQGVYWGSFGIWTPPPK